MAKIKSAWEIALEKTENIKIDEKRLKEKEETERIRRIAGLYLSGDERDDKKIENELKHFSPDALRKALSNTILSSLSLPQNEVMDDRFERLLVLLKIAEPNDERIYSLYDEVVKYLKQYPMHKKQLIEQMKAQLEPMLKEKEQKLSQEYGEPVHLTLEDDKESLEIIRNNIDRLNAMYDETLSKAKENLKTSLLG